MSATATAPVSTATPTPVATAAPARSRPPSFPNIAVFTGGSFNTPAIYTDLLTSTFSTVVLWSVRIDPAGDLSYAGPAGSLATKGVFNPSKNGPTTAWQQQVLALKTTAGSPVNRVELSFGVGSNPPDQTFPNLISIFSDPSDTRRKNLLANLTAVKKALALDAVCLDDEVSFDLTSSLAFSQMCGGLGMTVSVSPCGYSTPTYWGSLIAAANARVKLIDAIYLQAFATGTISGWALGGLNPCAGMYIDGNAPALTPAAATAQLIGWQQATPSVHLSGGWYYNAGELVQHAALGSFRAYSTAIAAALAS